MEVVYSMFHKYAVFLRYVISGFTSVVVQFGVLACMVEWLKIDSTIASGTGFIIGCIVNYLMLYYWTFKTNGKHLAATVKYTLVTSFGLVMNLFIFRFLTNDLKVWYLFSQTIATLIVSLLAYVLNKRFTFSGE